MANYTYSFDGGDQASLNTVLGRYNGEFQSAVRNAIGSLIPDSDTDADDLNIDFQLMDQDGADFDDEEYGGAYVGEGENFGNLDAAPIVLFDDTASDGDGADLTVTGDIDQFVGMTTYGDKFVAVASNNDGDLTVDAYLGNDTVTTGRGDDRVFGGDGADDILSGAGDDTVSGGRGDDEISAGRGDDVISGGRGNDTLRGESGDDEIDGGSGDDSIYGGNGASTVDGGSGFDVAVIKAGFEGFEFIDGTWTDGENFITNVEYVKLNDGVLITVNEDGQDDVARLFQMLTNADPTVAQLREALDLFDGSNLAEVALSIDADLPDDEALGLDELTADAAEIKSFVASLINNAFDDDPWNDAELTEYVDGLIGEDRFGTENILKSDIAADLVTKLADADEHIKIAISNS